MTDSSALAVVGGRWSVVDSYSQLILDQLERRNLFLVPLDDEQRWYRYHHLFGEMLRTRLLSGAALPEVAALHRRASKWYQGAWINALSLLLGGVAGTAIAILGLGDALGGSLAAWVLLNGLVFGIAGAVGGAIAGARLQRLVEQASA